MIADNDEIAALAYAFWEERGQPVGSAEVDWFRAEQEFWNRIAQDEQRTATHSHSEGAVTGGWRSDEEPLDPI